MKISLINMRYHPEGEAGPAFSVQTLAEALVSQGHTANVICLGDPACAVDEHHGVRIDRIPQGLPPTELIAQVRQVLKRDRPDVVHTNWLLGFPPVPLATVVREANARLVHTVREYGFLCRHGTMYRPWTGPCPSVCEECQSIPTGMQEFCQMVDGVVGVSRFCLEAHLKAGLFRQTDARAVIHNSFQGPDEPLPPPASGKPIRLGFLGRLHPVKGLLWLLRQLAASPLADRVHIVVGGKEQQELVTKVNQACPDLHIEWLGFVPPTQLMAQIDWLIVPSIWHEPLARVVFEAFSCGVPVLGSRMGGVPEIIRHGRNGRLFDPSVSGDVLREVAWILDHREQWPAYREQAWSSRLEFTPEKTAMEYLRFYESTCRLDSHPINLQRIRNKRGSLRAVTNDRQCASGHSQMQGI